MKATQRQGNSLPSRTPRDTQTSGPWGFSVTSVIMGTIFYFPQFPTVCGAIPLACLVPGTGGDFLFHCAVAFPSPGWFGLFSNWGLGSSSYIPDLPSSHRHSFLCPSLRTHNLISPSCRAEFLSTVSPPPIIWLSPDGPLTPSWCWCLSCL